LEIRASYLLVGTVVLLLAAGLVGFSVWLVKADINGGTSAYEIVFDGSVAGLQSGSAVRYRGIPVGRVATIRIDPKNVERVLATVELDRETPIKEDTEAVLEMQGITGIAYVELVGGTNEGPPLKADEKGETPRIPSRPSALEQVFESTPELLARGVEVVEKLSRLIDDDGIEAVGRTLENVAALSDTLAREGRVERLLGDASQAVVRVDEVSRELTLLSSDVRQLTKTIQDRVDGVGDTLIDTLSDLGTTADTLGGAASELDGLIGDIRQPMDDFAGSGLYEFTQLVGETRLLIAALTRITKEFERDPAGFLLGSGTKGFEPQ
jgi:phospholipid/cholesterol/gamma-HCH transport system substrate-binding protein